MSGNTKRTCFAAVVACAGVMLAGCHGAMQGKTEAASNRPVGSAAKDPMEISPAPALMKRLTLGEPRVTAVGASIRVAGRVEVDERRQARVGSPVAGRVVELLASVGEPVHRGQVLAKLHSTELSTAQFAFLKAYSQHELALRATERAKQLLDANVIGTAELQRRQAEAEQASAELASARAELQVLGLSEQAIDNLQSKRVLNSEFQVCATLDGTLLERKVTIGQIMQPADTAFLIADLSSVWLVADVPEQNAGHLVTGETVQAEIPALPGQKVSGRLSFVSSIVNPQTGTVTARMDVRNPHALYKPDMLATMILQDRPKPEHVIPSTAIVREENQDLVFIEKRPGTFALKKVSLGDQFNAFYVLKDGLKPGEKIVLDGAFHLNNERKRLLLDGGE